MRSANFRVRKDPPGLSGPPRQSIATCHPMGIGTGSMVRRRHQQGPAAQKRDPDSVEVLRQRRLPEHRCPEGNVRLTCSEKLDHLLMVANREESAGAALFEIDHVQQTIAQVERSIADHIQAVGNANRRAHRLQSCQHAGCKQRPSIVQDGGAFCSEHALQAHNARLGLRCAVQATAHCARGTRCRESVPLRRAAESAASLRLLGRLGGWVPPTAQLS